jgi:hypothetical protein
MHINHNQTSDIGGLILGLISYPLAVLLDLLPDAKTFWQTLILAGTASIGGYVALKVFKYFLLIIKNSFQKIYIKFRKK